MDFLIKFHNFKIGEDKAEFASDFMLLPARVTFGKAVYIDKTSYRFPLSARVVCLALSVLILPVVLVLTIAGLATLFFSKTHAQKSELYYHSQDGQLQKLQN